MNKIRLITKRVILNRIIISQIYKFFMVHVLSLFKDVDECKPNPCKNGATCTNTRGSFTCTCNPGWTGSLCDQGTWKWAWTENASFFKVGRGFAPFAQNVARYCRLTQMQSEMIKYTGYYVTFWLNKITYHKNYL